MSLTKEQETWLANSRETYEFYLLHAILHDPLRRSSMLSVPVQPADFIKEEAELILHALIHAVKVMRACNLSMPTPPTMEFMKSYMESASTSEGTDREALRSAYMMLMELLKPSYREQWYCINPYFEAWYGGVQGKRIAREIQASPVPDMAGAVSKVQRALAAAVAATASDEEDEMSQVMEGTEFEMTLRTPTGIEGLDASMNGGWGDGECSLLFGGTGAGKSIGAGQCAWHIALTGGFPLIVSTELRPREYVSRMVSCAASVPINLIQDCGNFVQIRSAVAQAPGMAFKEAMVEKVLKTIKERVRVAKVSPDAGMDARSTLEREREKYKQQVGCYPTWICLDWLGSMADVGGGGKGTSERAMAWEMSAASCVAFADVTNTATLVLAQAVNDSQLKRILSIQDIGISKGIAKNMVCAIGITNSMDQAGVKAAVSGQREMPSSMFLEDQFFCTCKARKGEGQNIAVRRDFRYQRFIARPRT
jgi:hypothetical protein